VMATMREQAKGVTFARTLLTPAGAWSVFLPDGRFCGTVRRELAPSVRNRMGTPKWICYDPNGRPIAETSPLSSAATPCHERKYAGQAVAIHFLSDGML
jgi:hypothetical protein